MNKQVQGWSLENAEAEMPAFGFNDAWINFKKFISQYGNNLLNPQKPVSRKSRQEAEEKPENVILVI